MPARAIMIVLELGSICNRTLRGLFQLMSGYLRNPRLVEPLSLLWAFLWIRLYNLSATLFNFHPHWQSWKHENATKSDYIPTFSFMCYERQIEVFLVTLHNDFKLSDYNIYCQRILRGKYHCTIDLLFDWFEINCMTTDNFCFYLQNRLIQTSQTGQRATLCML